MQSRLPDQDDDTPEQADINITPFIDVMLVLLIIFMVAAPLSTVDISVDLPTSSARVAARPPQPIFITIDKSAVWSVGETPVVETTLISAIEAMTDGKRETRLFLRADQDVRYGEVMRLTERLREAGYLKVALVAREAPPTRPVGASP
jgi:biopolymer transport protein ExbD